MPSKNARPSHSQVEEEDDEDEDDYERSKHNSTGGGHPPSTTTVSAAPSDRVYRYQVRPVAAARTFASSKPNSDAGSIALSDKYRRVQQARSKRSDDQARNSSITVVRINDTSVVKSASLKLPPCNTSSGGQ